MEASKEGLPGERERDGLVTLMLSTGRWYFWDWQSVYLRVRPDRSEWTWTSMHLQDVFLAVYNLLNT